MIETHGTSMIGAHYARLGNQEREKIHMATLEILERVGIDVHDERARAILVSGGARSDGIRIRVPAHMVERALSVVPKRMTLYDRSGRPAIRAWGYRTYFGGGSDCLNILDHRNGVRRRPVLQDVVDAVRVQDALPELEFVMSMVLPEDVDQRLYDRYQMREMLSHTTKPIVFVTPDLQGTKAAVEMCEAVAGGTDAFQRAPFATCYINVTTGLVANEEAVQKCIYLAQKGLPMLYIPLNAAGVNSPATTAGCMASMNAGTMLGLVLSQLVREGTPVAVPGWNGGPYNLKTMVGNYVLADEQGIAIEMGRHYGLPVFGLGGSTDSKVLDQQCGLEVSISLMTALIHGANIVHDVGFMDSGLQASLQLQVIADDFIGFLRAATAGVPVNDETLALDVIEEMGPQGNYLGHEHTLRHYKDPYYSKLADKGVYAKWLNKGGTTMEQRAAQEVERILSSHAAEPLPAEILQKLDRIVEREQALADSRA